MSAHSLKQITNNISRPFKFIGDENSVSVTKLSTIENVDQSSIAWLSQHHPNRIEFLKRNAGGLVITHFECQEFLSPDANYILVDNPRHVFVEIASALFLEKKKHEIHSSAIIHPEAKIGRDVYIGPNVVIGKCNIGDDVILQGNNFIYDNTVIGNSVVIQAGTIIGSDGFGYSKQPTGELIRFPHFGGVVIGDFVEIGANTCIDRGTLGNTVISDGVKIDNLVHIAHNVEIGKNSVVIALAMVGGSTKIGENVWVAPSSSIRDGLTIGDSSLIGMGSTILKNVPSKEIWIGNPGKPKES